MLFQAIHSLRLRVFEVIIADAFHSVQSAAAALAVSVTGLIALSLAFN